MAKTKISEFSATPANNTDIDSINIAEGCAPSGINDAIRELMAQLKDFQTGAVGDSFNGPIGASTASTGAFTTLSSTGNTTLGDASGDAVTINGTATFANANPTLTAGTANGVTYLNGSKVLTSGSALTFDGTNLSTSGLYVSSAATGRLSKSVSTGRNLLTGGITGGTTDGAYVITEGYDYGGTAAGGKIQIVTAGASSPITFEINGTEGMRLTSTGLGIGTSSPSFPSGSGLAIYNSSVPRLKFSNSTTGDASTDGTNLLVSGSDFYIQQREAASVIIATNGADRATIDSAGNLGLGVTPSVYWGGNKGLDVGSVGCGLTSRQNNEINLCQNAAYNTYATNGVASRFSIGNDGAFYWSQAPSGTTGNAISFTVALSLERNKSLALQGAVSQSGTGITFPATQSASSDANTLDDYEEGTFTPTVLTEFGSATTGGQTSVYTKVGNIVNVCGSFNIATISSPSGILRVGNLPFSVASVGVNGVNASASLWNTASSYASLTPWVYTFNGQPQFYIRFTNGTSATEGAGLLKVGTEIWFNVTYRVS